MNQMISVGLLLVGVGSAVGIGRSARDRAHRTLDQCVKYGWDTCDTDDDCSKTWCRKRLYDFNVEGAIPWNPIIHPDCSYNSYTCRIPSELPGCHIKRCVPVPESAFFCNEDADCESVTSHGDVSKCGLLCSIEDVDLRVQTWESALSIIDSLNVGMV